MPKIGRNDPCPEDSGKKFKKCCALKAYTEIGSEESIRRSSIDEILRFARRQYEDEIDYAYEEFWGDFDPTEQLEGPSFDIAYGNYMDWLIHDWTDDFGDERTLIERYIDNKSKRLTQDELTVLNKMKGSTISLYEVQEV